MEVIDRIRRKLAYLIYKPPEPVEDYGQLTTEGLVTAALDTHEKRSVVMYLAYHMGSRRYYAPDNGGSYTLDSLSDRIVRDASLTTSTDPTDYDNMNEYREIVGEAQLEHLRENVLPDLVDLKVIEVISDYQKWVKNSNELQGVATGIRPGPRFEQAVQALRWIDVNGTDRNWESVT